MIMTAVSNMWRLVCATVALAPAMDPRLASAQAVASDATATGVEPAQAEPRIPPLCQRLTPNRPRT